MIFIFVIGFISLNNISGPCVGGTYFDVKVKDSLIYFVTGRGLEIYHRNRIKNEPLSRFPTDGWAYGIDIRGRYAYIADFYKGLCIIDVKNLKVPQLIKSIETGGKTSDVFVDSAFAYLADGENGLSIISVLNPMNPYHVGRCSNIGNAFSVSVKDTFAFIGTTDNSLKIISISNPAKPYVVGELPKKNAECIDCYIEDTLAYINCNYKSKGNNISFAIVNIKDLNNTRLIAELDISLTNKGIKKIGNFIYTNTQHNGISIIDVSDSKSPFLVKRVCESSEFGYGYDNFDDYLIAPQFIDGFAVVNIKNPKNPIVHYKHENINWSYIALDYKMNYLYIIGNNPSNNSTLKIFNIVDSEKPIPVGEINFNGRGSLYDRSADYPYLAITIRRGRSQNESLFTEILDMSKLPDIRMIKYIQGGGITEIHRPYLYSLDKNKIRIFDITNSSSWIDSIVLNNVGYDIMVQDTLIFLTVKDSLLVFDIKSKRKTGSCFHGRPGAVNIAYEYPYLALPYTPFPGSTYGFMIFDIQKPSKPMLIYDTIINMPAVNPMSIAIMGSTFSDSLLLLGRGNYGFDIWNIKSTDGIYRVANQETPYSATNCYPSGNSNIVVMANVIFLIDRCSLEMYRIKYK